MSMYEYIGKIACTGADCCRDPHVIVALMYGLAGLGVELGAAEVGGQLLLPRLLQALEAQENEGEAGHVW
jgi:hypothetical protein